MTQQSSRPQSSIKDVMLAQIALAAEIKAVIEEAKQPTLQSQLEQLIALVDVAMPLADNLRHTLKAYPDTSGTESGAAELVLRSMGECFGRLRYLQVAFRRDR